MENEYNLKIELTGLRFFGHYGFYQLESKWITELIIDLSIQFKLPVMDSIQMKDTIDYTLVYQEVSAVMKRDHQLLESIAAEVIGNLKKLDERIGHCKVRISKKPAIGGPLNQIAVEMEY